MITRVCCVDGPCQGLQYLNLDTGRIIFSDCPHDDRCVYRISVGESASTIAGSYPAAYFDGFGSH